LPDPVARTMITAIAGPRPEPSTVESCIGACQIAPYGFVPGCGTRPRRGRGAPGRDVLRCGTRAGECGGAVVKMRTGFLGSD
jgi:hypothetical protein